MVLHISFFCLFISMYLFLLMDNDCKSSIMSWRSLYLLWALLDLVGLEVLPTVIKNKPKNEWIDGSMKESLVGWINGWIGEWIRKNGRMSEYMHGKMSQ